MVATTESVHEFRGEAARLVPHVLRRIDGHASLLTIAKECGIQDRIEPFISLCQRLVDDGLLVVDGFGPGAAGVYEALPWAAMAGHQDQRPVLPSQPLQVVGTDDQVDAIARAIPGEWPLQRYALSDLEDSGHGPGTCTVVWVDNPNDQLLAKWNEHAYEQRSPWLPITDFDGYAAVVGPFVYPPETPCYECYRRRRASHSSLGEGLLDFQPVEPFRLANTAFTHLLAAITALQLQGWATVHDPHVPGAVTIVTLAGGLQFSREYVLKVPRCEACRPLPASTRPALWSEYFEIEEQ